MKKAYQLNDQQLTTTLKDLLAKEHQVQARFLYYLAELERRRLWANLGYSSCFSYLTEGLGYARGPAYRRLSVARLSLKVGSVLKSLEDGSLTLTTAAMLAKTIKDQERSIKEAKEMIAQARGKSERDIERLFCRVIHNPKLESTRPVKVHFTKADQESSPGSQGEKSALLPIEPSNLLDPSSATKESFPAPAPTVKDEIEPIQTTVVEMVEVTVTLTQDEYKEFLRMRDLTRVFPKHNPTNDQAHGPMKTILVKAVDHWLAKNDPLRKKSTQRSTPKQTSIPNEIPAEKQTRAKQAQQTIDKCDPVAMSVKKSSTAGNLTDISKQDKGTATKGRRSRYIPRWVISQVWHRDGSRCTYRASDGTHCSGRSQLEVDHILGFARGGSSTDPNNLRLRCRAHNHLAAEETYGQAFMGSFLSGSN